MTDTGSHPPLVRLLGVAGLAGGAAWFAVAVDGRIFDPLAGVLAIYVVGANLLAVRFGGPLWVSASFTVSMLAVVTLGPAAAFAIVAVGELASWAVERYRPTAAAINLVGAGLPNLAAGTLYEQLPPSTADGPAGAVALLGIATLALALNYLVVRTLTSAGPDGKLALSLALPRRLAGPLAVNLGLTVTFALLAQRSGLAVVCAGAVLAAVALRQMLALTVADQRDRVARADFTLGLVDGLIRSLAQRDPAAARHAAAVAHYARHIASASGMDEAGCGAAHTAGLLHDVGMIALSDRTLAGEQALAYEDWAQIRRHPELGATTIRGLGAVAEAVRCHHERPDGRGYPRGLPDDEIPALAAIVAVAEVYDTLTRRDGAAKSSFEALRELRRVAGSQLREQYVEALATVLAGRPADERHGARVTVDEELAAHSRTVAAGAT